MALGLEIAGVVRELAEPADVAAKPMRPLVRLRDSHHQVARLLARGLTPQEVSLQTGYAISRLSVLQGDPSFKELMAFYRQNAQEAALSVEAQLLLVAKDAMQAFHERILDAPEEMASQTILDGAKTFLDRAGYAPVQRSINKNLNLSIAKRYDEEIDKKDKVA